MTEDKLELLLEFGLITGEEKKRLLEKYRQSGKTTEVIDQIITIIDHELQVIEYRNAELGKEEDELFAKKQKATEKIREIREKRTKVRSEIALKKYEAIIKQREKESRENWFRVQSAFRKINDLGQEYLKIVDHKKVDSIRSKLNQN